MSDVNKQLLNALKMVLDDPDALDGRPRTYECVVEAIAAAEQAQADHIGDANEMVQAEPVVRDVLMALGIEIADKAHSAGAIGNTFMDEEVAAIVDRYAAQKGGA